MRRRTGFTLLEVMVAIVITGVVALLAYGTARAGFDTADRLERYRTTLEAQMIVRSLLLNALRHPPESGGAALNDVLFALEDQTSAEGVPADAVHFFSRGIMPPFGASELWSVTLAPSAGGVRILALPVEWKETANAPIDALLPGTSGLSVRVLRDATDTSWSELWDAPGRVPAAVSIEFLSGTGAAVAPAVVVHSSLELPG